MIKRYKHSGTLGDIVYSLPIMRHLGAGEFYLHLNQIDWIVKHYYGGSPDPFHQGRMTQEDFEFMKSFMLAQDYVTDFQTMTDQTEITHNLDRFRPKFVGHPGNYVNIYAEAFGITDSDQQAQLRNQPWLSVPNTRDLASMGKRFVINRTGRWRPNELNPAWDDLKAQGAEREGIFIGLESEHRAFEQLTGWNIDWVPCDSLLDMAELIAGADQFIGNQSVALSLAIGLGIPYACEVRRDLPIERNECYFPDHPNGDYF